MSSCPAHAEQPSEVLKQYLLENSSFHTQARVNVSSKPQTVQCQLLTKGPMSEPADARKRTRCLYTTSTQPNGNLSTSSVGACTCSNRRVRKESKRDCQLEEEQGRMIQQALSPLPYFIRGNSGTSIFSVFFFMFVCLFG